MISNIEDLSRKEKSIYIAAVDTCLDYVENSKITVREAIAETICIFGQMVQDTNRLEKVLYQETTQEASPYTLIMTEEVKKRDWWTKLKLNDEVKTYYFNRYFSYLRKKGGWSDVSIKDLDKSTDEVMNALANPTYEGADERRGLVYGDVQSGKTAHYMGVINKAVASGYQIIIVLTGMHNSLRSQTQSRIDEEVLGYETSSREKADSQSKNLIGVGLEYFDPNDKPLMSLTNRDEKGDFNRTIATVSSIPPFVIVTKKVNSVLKNIIRALSQSTIAEVKEGKKIIPNNYPALIIDDEADQASINTNDMEKTSNPSAINGTIRELLNLFECKSYVGYTATPFANIFIPHRTDDDNYGKDLFPKDFIARAPRPHLYVGAKEFFGLDEEGYVAMPLMRPISEGEYFLPKGTKKDDFVGELPIELKDAVKYFMISIAIRNLRGQRNKPNTMLVHIGRFVNHQGALKKKIVRYLEEEIFNYIEGGDLEIKNEFYEIYINDFLVTTKQMNAKFPKYSEGGYEVEFNDVWIEIDRLVKEREIDTFEVNGNSSDNLIYKNHKGEVFNVIAVGGNKLSRGLTLEGLTISYFTRSASAMDTLLQMGRWFGYRPGYLDLCRIFTTEDLYLKFKAISFSAENLASQFDDMNISKSRPDEFGLKIATNPDILISARNKIRTGADYSSDFSNKLTQTRLLDADPEIVEENYQAVNQFLSSLDEYRLDKLESGNKLKYIPAEEKAGKFYWVGVPGERVAQFFGNFRTSKYATKASSKLIKDYIDTMREYNGLIDWTVCLCGTTNKNKSSKIATESKYGPIEVNGITRNLEDKNDSRITNKISEGTTRDLQVLTSFGDEELDYTLKQVHEANKLKKQLKNETQRKQSIARKVRSKVRDFEHGFLLLYPIEWAADDLQIYNDKAPYAFAVVFPDRGNKGKLKQYKLNEIALELEEL